MPYTDPAVLALLHQLATTLQCVQWIEWLADDGQPVTDESPVCPWCDRSRTQGHTASCPRQRALRAANAYISNNATGRETSILNYLGQDTP